MQRARRSCFKANSLEMDPPQRRGLIFQAYPCSKHSGSDTSSTTVSQDFRSSVDASIVSSWDSPSTTYKWSGLLGLSSAPSRVVSPNPGAVAFESLVAPKPGSKTVKKPAPTTQHNRLSHNILQKFAILNVPPVHKPFLADSVQDMPSKW